MVVVGWDNPMHTYFAQVERVATSEKEHEAPVMLWLGGTPDGVPSTESLREPLAPFATLSDDMLCQLHDDRAVFASQSPHNCSAPTSICFEAAVDPEYYAQCARGGANPLRVGVIPVGAIFYIQNEDWCATATAARPSAAIHGWSKPSSMAPWVRHDAIRTPACGRAAIWPDDRTSLLSDHCATDCSANSQFDR